jgi:hypothetical protein
MGHWCPINYDAIAAIGSIATALALFVVVYGAYLQRVALEVTRKESARARANEIALSLALVEITGQQKAIVERAVVIIDDYREQAGFHDNAALIWLNLSHDYLEEGAIATSQGRFRPLFEAHSELGIALLRYDALERERVRLEALTPEGVRPRPQRTVAEKPSGQVQT